MGEAQLGEICAAHELGDFRMDRVHLVFQFIGLDEITVEVCRQRGSPRTEPRLTSSMGLGGDREEPAKGLLPDK